MKKSYKKHVIDMVNNLNTRLEYHMQRQQELNDKIRRLTYEGRLDEAEFLNSELKESQGALKELSLLRQAYEVIGKVH